MDQRSFETTMAMLKDSSNTMGKITDFLDEAELPTKEVVVSMLYLACSEAMDNLPKIAILHMVENLCNIVEGIKEMEKIEQNKASGAN